MPITFAVIGIKTFGPYTSIEDKVDRSVTGGGDNASEIVLMQEEIP